MSPFSVALMNMYSGLTTRVWITYQCPCPWRKVIIPLKSD